MTGRVLVVGGQGFFGRALVKDLLERTDASIVTAGRRRRRVERDPRVSWLTMDLRTPPPLAGYAVVVCCAGPFQGMSTALVEAAAEAGVAYFDLADARDFVARARAIDSPAPRMVGLSVVPGLTCLLAARARVGRPLRVRTMIAPGSRPPRGGATMASLLSGVARWGDPERVRFPRPVGRRTVYRAIEVGDVDVVPELFEGASFEFRVGFDQEILNLGVGALRWLPDPRRFGPLLAAGVRVMSVLGTEAGAARVEVEGTEGRYVGSVVARDRGYRIVTGLASIAVARCLDGRLTSTRLDGWLPDVGEELAARGLELVERRFRPEGTAIRT